MTHEPQIGAVFEDRAHAEGAVEDLREMGLADEHLGVAVHSPDTHVFEEDLETDVGHGIEKGIALGAPLGAVAGISVLAVVSAATGLGLGGLLAAGAVTGGLAGGFWGAYLGLTAEVPEIEREIDWEHVSLEPGEVLVVVCQHGDPAAVTRCFTEHGGRLVHRPAHRA